MQPPGIQSLRPVCIVCGDPVIFPAPQFSDPVCQSVECRNLLGQKPLFTPVAFAQFLRYRSQLIRDKRAKESREQDTLRQVRAQMDEENQAYWQSKVVEPTPELAPRFPLLVVPNNRRKLCTLPEQRKRRFRDRINKLISAVSEAPDSVYTDQLYPDPAPPTAKLLTYACTACRGACCLTGRDHAYIREQTIVRVMQTHQDLRPRHILELYVSHLGNKTFEGACVYQGERGCVLPAELRACICSDFYCHSLTEFNRDYEENPTQGAFVLVRAREKFRIPEAPDGGIVGSYFITEAGMRPVD